MDTPSLGTRMNMPIDAHWQVQGKLEDDFLQSVIRASRKNNPFAVESDHSDTRDSELVTVDSILDQYIKDGRPLAELLDEITER